MGIILNDKMKIGVLSVKRRSDRIIWVKIALNGEIINIMSAYASYFTSVKMDVEMEWVSF